MTAAIDSPLKLNLGCGHDRLPGFLGVDLFPCPGMDVQHDLNHPLPFPDNSVVEVVAEHVIEHLRDVPAFIKDLHRVCRDGATIRLATPHFASFTSFIDPTHIQHLSYFSLDHFVHGDCHYLSGGFRMVRRRISFSGHPLGLIGRLIAWLSPREYEKRWCYFFRPSSIEWELAVSKP